jgi:hypothetical protein
MLFKFFRKHLETYSVAFAGGEAFPSVAGEIIDLTETSEVVQLLLQLMSLERHPNLMTLEFSVLAQLVDALEKHEVMSALSICDMAMRFVYFSRGDFRKAERIVTERQFQKVMPWRCWTEPREADMLTPWTKQPWKRSGIIWTS